MADEPFPRASCIFHCGGFSAEFTGRVPESGFLFLDEDKHLNFFCWKNDSCCCVCFFGSRSQTFDVDSRGLEKTEVTGTNTVSPPPRRSPASIPLPPEGRFYISSILIFAFFFFPSFQSFIKHKKTFQQLFPDISKEEELIHCKLSHRMVVGG